MLYNQNKTFNIYERTKDVSKYLTNVFLTMSLGLLTTFVTSFLMINVFTNISIIFLSNPILFIGTAISQIVIVFLLVNKVKNMDSNNISLFYYLYTFLNGLILTYVYFVYRIEIIIIAFLATTVFFGSMATYGAITKKDLSTWGSILGVCFFSIGIVSLILFISQVIFHYQNIFLSLMVSIGTIIVLSLYTAYDVQNIIKSYNKYKGNKNNENVISVFGAFNLYLNFINIFIHLLRVLSYLSNDNKK